MQLSARTTRHFATAYFLYRRKSRVIAAMCAIAPHLVDIIKIRVLEYKIYFLCIKFYGARLCACKEDTSEFEDISDFMVQHKTCGMSGNREKKRSYRNV